MRRPTFIRYGKVNLRLTLGWIVFVQCPFWCTFILWRTRNIKCQTSQQCLWAGGIESDWVYFLIYALLTLVNNVLLFNIIKHSLSSCLSVYLFTYVTFGDIFLFIKTKTSVKISESSIIQNKNIWNLINLGIYLKNTWHLFVHTTLFYIIQSF